MLTAFHFARCAPALRQFRIEERMTDSMSKTCNQKGSAA